MFGQFITKQGKQVHRQFRKATNAKHIFPNYDSLRKNIFQININIPYSQYVIPF